MFASLRANVHEHRGTVDIWTDIFGLEPVFAYRDSTRVILSTSIEEMGRIRSTEHTRPDPIGFIAALMSDAALGTQMSIRRTALEGVELLPVERATRVTLGDIDVSVQSALEGTEKQLEALGPDDYPQLLASGVEEVVENVGAVLQDGRFARQVINVTGGKDSRLLVAAAMATGRASDFEAMTNGSRDSDDVRLGSAVARYAGIDYASEPLGRVHLSDRAAVFKEWTEWSLGSYHEVQLPAGAVDDSDAPVLRLIGGCGELYRGFHQSRYPQNILETVPPSSEVILSAFHDVIDRDIVKPDVLRQYRAELDDWIGESLDQSLSRQLDRHYLEFRNRLHIGASGQFNARYMPQTVNPLASTHLYMASRVIGARDREKARVVHDVLYSLDPMLAAFEFDGRGDQWNAEWLDGVRASLPDGRDAWSRASQRRAAAELDMRSDQSAPASPTLVYEAEVSNAAAALHDMADLPFSVEKAVGMADWYRSQERVRMHSIWASRLSAAARLWVST